MFSFEFENLSQLAPTLPLVWSVLCCSNECLVLPLCTRQSGLLREALAEPMWQVGDPRCWWRQETEIIIEMSEKSLAYFRTTNCMSFFVVWPSFWVILGEPSNKHRYYKLNYFNLFYIIISKLRWICQMFLGVHPPRFRMRPVARFCLAWHEAWPCPRLSEAERGNE